MLASVVMNGASVLVGSVYLPQNRKSRKSALKALKKAVIREADESDHVILMGDLNYNRAEIQKLVVDIDFQVSLLELSAPSETWHGAATKRWTTIDHFLVSPDSVALFSRTEVLRDWSFSDHFAISTTITITAPTSEDQQEESQQPTRARLRKEHFDPHSQAIRNNNRFGALLEAMESDDPSSAVSVEDATEQFLTINRELMTETAEKTFGDRSTKRHTHLLPKKIIRVIERRKQCFEAKATAADNYRANPGVMSRTMCAKAEREYEIANDQVTLLVKEYRKTKFAKHVDRVIKMKACQQDTRSTWAFCHGLMNPKVARKSMLPIKGESGDLLTNPREIKQEWMGFQTNQSADQTGHSKSRRYWEDILPPTSDRAVIPSLNVPVTYAEVQRCVRGMSKGKAPGASGITVDWLAMAIDGKQDTEPKSSFGKCLYWLVKRIFEQAAVSRSLKTSVVVTIPKPGKDHSEMKNYRGISLMEAVLKVADTLAQRRLCEALEANSILSPCQGGFRTKEEAVAVAVAFFEIVERRKQEGKPTYVLFMDIEKAFDTVPHEAMFRKLEHAGVRGMMLDFIKASYKEANLVLRLADATTDAIPLDRGVRQGASSSPTLFNVFFDDLVESLNCTAIDVPGVNQKLPGLFFADDVLAPAENRKQLQVAANRMQKWAKKWEINFNASKCKAMVIHGNNNDLKNNPIKLGDEILETVDDFKYLGITVTTSFSLKAVTAANAQSALNSLFMLRPFLKASIPLNLKLMVIKGAVLPKILYGSELYGCDKIRSHIAQQAVNPYLRLALTASEKSTAGSNLSLWRESGVAPIYAKAAKRRVRLYLKSKTMKTWLAILQRSPWKNRKKGEAWFDKTHWTLTHQLKALKANTDAEKLPRIEPILWATFEKSTLASEEMNSFKRYQCWATSSSYISVDLYETPWMTGVFILAKMRTGAYVLADRLTHSKPPYTLPPEYCKKCPSCLLPVKETLGHIL